VNIVKITDVLKKKNISNQNTNKKSGRATPLMAAAASGHNETVELLIGEGAEINVIMRDAIDRNLTAVDIAEQKGNKDTAELLRKHGGKTGEELKAEGK
jgi:ankyrin repeat protein